VKNLSKCSWTASTISLVFNIKAMYSFNCSSGLEFLHTKCELVHGDLSINNIVIYRFPLTHPPLKDHDGKQPFPPTTWASVATAQAAFTPAPKEEVTEDHPVSGIVIDYDYARKIGTTTERPSVYSRCSQNCSVLILILF
jgi:hypothetical protein